MNPIIDYLLLRAGEGVLPAPTPIKRTTVIKFSAKAAAPKQRHPTIEPTIMHGNSPTHRITTPPNAPVKFKQNLFISILDFKMLSETDGNKT